MRLSTTTVESYRLFRTFDWMEEDSMIRTALGLTEWTPRMAVGSGFEAAVNGEGSHSDGVIKIDSDHGAFYFEEKDAERIASRLPEHRLPQVKAQATVCGHDLVGVADYICGAEIRDLKCTQKTINSELYVRSLQWQSYLRLFGGKRFWFDVCHMEEGKDGVWRVRDFEQIVCSPYPGMDDYLDYWVHQYTAWYEQMEEGGRFLCY
jgi:hypothetical protein